MPLQGTPLCKIAGQTADTTSILAAPRSTRKLGEAANEVDERGKEPAGVRGAQETQATNYDVYKSE